MAPGDEPIDIDRNELSGLIERVEEAIEHELALSVEDMKLLLSAISTLCTLQSQLEQDDITLSKLRKLLGMIRQSEKRSNTAKKGTSRTGKRGNGHSSKKDKPKRLPPKTEHHQLQAHQKGDLCPACARGKLYKFEPGKLLRITGHARYEATQHIVEQMRCNACWHVEKAPLPESVLEDGDANQMYGYSARSLMVLDKFYSGLPYNHQENLADIFGFPISASTIYDQCELVANDAKPLIYELKRQAAQASGFLIDDTRNRILAQKPELRDKRNGRGKQLRSGVYTSGLIALCDEGQDIILFETSLGHAGEHLDCILEKRPAGLPAPQVMSDALSSNQATKVSVIHCFCNSHARRLFFDLEGLYPDELGPILDAYSQIWENELVCKQHEFDPMARLAYHQAHSLPVMQSIKDWGEKKLQADDFEEHSALGKAIRYYLNHFEELTQFCKLPGARIDNNRMEEKLKIPIRGRKTAHFYKTAIGAGVANDLISLIATALSAKVNVYDYLCAIQRHKGLVKQRPQDWVPWKFQETLAAIKSEKIDNTS